jgi:hypothetical protein
MMFTTSNLDYSFVSKRLEDGRSELSSGTTVPCSTLDTRSIREHISVAGQMQGVVAAALHKHQMTHVIVMLLLLDLLGARRGTMEVMLLLFLMRVLMTVLLS